VYATKPFAITDRVQQLALLERYPFGTLSTVTAGRIRQSAIPFLLEPDAPELLGHLARENPHWQELTGCSDLLVTCLGPHGYISPNWYHNHDLVPTWNYVAIEVRGRASLLETRSARLALVDRMSERFERQLPQPWRTDKLQPRRRDAMLDAIVAFRIDIESIDAKAKLGQNREPVDIQSAARALVAIDAVSIPRQLAALMFDCQEPGPA
jgi:transcriptional regulator